jgi:hypothetical protein
LNGQLPPPEVVQVWQETRANLERSNNHCLEREPTPPPGPLTSPEDPAWDPAWDPIFDWDDFGRDELRTNTVHFLLNTHLWRNLGHRHISVRFGPSYERGRWVDRIAQTELDRFFGRKGPVDRNTTVAIFWTGHKKDRRHDDVNVECLLPAPPRSKGSKAVVLEGEHMGEVVTVSKYMKKTKRAVVQVDGGLVSWEDDENKFCMISDPILGFMDVEIQRLPSSLPSPGTNWSVPGVPHNHHQLPSSSEMWAQPGDTPHVPTPLPPPSPCTSLPEAHTDFRLAPAEVAGRHVEYDIRQTTAASKPVSATEEWLEAWDKENLRPFTYES